jgi:arylsulfatase A-like enzyme
LLTNTLLNAIKINYLTYKRSAKRALSISEQISKKAESFNEATALSQLGANTLNGFYYRFDDNLMYASISGKKFKRQKNSQKIQNISFDFDDPDSLPIRPVKNTFIIEKGILKYKHDKKNFMESFEALNIDKDDIGEIEIRIKVKKTKKLILGWSKHLKASALDPYQTDYLTLWTIPDNQFHIYRVDAQPVFRGGLKSGEPIRKLFLFPFEISSDEVEIDYLRFISKSGKYAQKPYGTIYETKNNEMRKVIYVHPQLDLRYTLNIPEGQSIFEFGMGILSHANPIQFQVVIKHDDKQKEIFSKKISDAGSWHDVSIDLSRYANSQVAISLKTKGSDKNIAFWTNPVLFTPPAKRMNVVIVLEDALRSDRISGYGYSHATTPVKDKFIKKGIVFLNAFSQATHTRSSCASFMTSLYPSTTGVWRASEMLNDRYLTLAEIMRSQGFATASFTQNVNAGPNVGLHQGFSTILDFEILGHRAHEMYQAAALDEWLNNNSDRNFFIYLHLLDPHGPYDPPEDFIAAYKKPYLGGKKRVKKDNLLDPDWLQIPTVESRNYLYDQEIRYNDLQFESFLKTLEKYKLLEDTLIIFIADHGEHLGEHLIWEHRPPGYIQVLHVPLVMVYPQKLPINRRIQQPVQLLDIMPTILDLVSIKKDNFLIQGDSLLPLINDKQLDFWNNRFCISEEVKFKRKEDPTANGSIFYKNWHILNSDRLNDTISQQLKNFNKTLYDILPLDTRIFDLLEDKNEHYDLINFLVDIFFNYQTQTFLNKFKQHNVITWRTLTKDAQQTIQYDPATLEQLRSLGYVK